jgi:RNA polymerase sigma-70 factor (ECF subfamily)
MGEVAAINAGKQIFMRAETELIQRCQRGDQSAFEALLKRYERKVFGLVYRIIRSPKDVEDLAQEVFIKLYFSLPQFRLEASLDAWVYRIAVNQCYDHLRKQKRHSSVSVSDLSEEEAAGLEGLQSTTQPSPTDIERALEVKQTAERLLSLLHPKDRMLLILKEVEQFSIEELGEIFRMSHSAIKLRLFRARRQLQAVYEKSRKKRNQRNVSHVTP